MLELALIYPRPSHIIDSSSSGLSSTPKDEVDPEVLEADNIVSSTEAKSPAQVEAYDPHDEICMDMEFSPLTPVFPEFVDNCTSFCPECLLPLYEANLIHHFNHTHSIRCWECRDSFNTLDSYMNHLIRIHFGRIFAMLSPLTLQHMTEIAQANQVTTPWENQWRNLIHPTQVNTYLPELYSRDFLEMVESSTANDSPLYRILLPYCPRGVV